ncbi:MAG: hypothetical protein HC806_02140 [Anaerolineae bacterium]|nr:hypothetical protein [Anaerolineae bacterium]
MLLAPSNIRGLYAGFDTPLANVDCGNKCAPYNGGIPYCCDILHAVPTAYPKEWIHLRTQTDLWQVWKPKNKTHRDEIQAEAGDLILLECMMLPEHGCSRDLRTLVCRAFPFFPYINSQGEILGLSYYWEYQERCWVISNLQIVRPEFKNQFLQTYETLFDQMPTEHEAFQYHSAEMRRIFQKRRRTIPLLHRDGHTYKISPASEKMHRTTPESLPKYGPYKIADALLFPDEI